MILAEITAAIDDAGTERVFYRASGPYATTSSDTPSAEPFLSALAEPGSLGVSVYRSGRTGGYGSLEVGELRLVNSDGRHDPWIDYGFDGRQVVLRLYKVGVPYAQMPKLFTGTVDGPPEITRAMLRLRLRDKQHVLEVPVCANFYGGTNIPPDGVDGLPGDLKGRRLPRGYGHVLNATPDQVNTSLQIFRVHDGAVADITDVYDQGAPFTKHSDYPNNAALQAAAVPAGNYATCFAEGLFRLNSSIAGQVTADFLEGATVASRSAAQVIKRIALAAGLSTDEISEADVINLDAMQPAVVGIYLTGETSAREAINLVAESIGAYVVFDTNGVLRMGRLSEPAGTPSLILTESQWLSLERQAQQDGDLPNYAVKLNHTRNWTPQDSDLAGSVDQDRRAFLKETYRPALAEAGSVKLKHPLSPLIEADSLIVDADNAVGGPADLEAKRLLALYRVRRDLIRVVIHLDVLRGAAPPELMSLVQLNGTRPALASGKLFWVLGVRLELRRSQVELMLWG